MIGSLGCGSTTVQVRWNGSAQVNHGLPFSVLVRAVSIQSSRAEPYAAVSHLISNPDSTVLDTQILTGTLSSTQARMAKVIPPKQGGLAIYCFYTDPRGRWRAFFAPPFPTEIEVRLGETGIAEILASKQRVKTSQPSQGGTNLPELSAPALPEGTKKTELPAPPVTGMVKSTKGS